LLFQIIIQKYESFCFLCNLAAMKNPSDMLLILTPAVTNRLRYIAALMVKELLGLEVEFTPSADEFAGYKGPRLCYAKEPMAEGLFIPSCGLLSETSVLHREVTYGAINGVPALFVATEGNEPGFDLFAAAFYMVSRHEEYDHHKKDTFGRFPATESIAWRNGFLELPVVNLWARMLGELLKKHVPSVSIHQPEYRFTPTIDIDHAWCYRGRTFSRTLGGIGRSLMNLRPGEVVSRLKVLGGVAPDPYDTYSFIREAHGPDGIDPLWFILFADYGRDDNNVTLTSRIFHRLVQDLDRHRTVGIHPSLSSNKHLLKLEDEYYGLCDLVDRPVTISRQHFLKLSMPKTYRTLIGLGITDDYSMGYASHLGFRAGMASPFPFFDLSRNEVTPLIIHPVSVMDVTIVDYLRLNRDEGLKAIVNVIDTVKSSHGEFVSLWHNESLGEMGRWKGWREVYIEMVKKAIT
jgi:hypothetical protein